jgi:type IV pilus assembly protein PilM
MLSGTKGKSIVGLDIEAGSVAAAEVRVNGGVEVLRHGLVPLPPGAFREGEVVDADLLASAVKELFASHKLPKTVRVGVANQRVVVRTLRLPPIENPSELETAVRFQAQDHIPMPLEQAVLDWEVVRATPSIDGADPAVDVVVVAARQDMVSNLTRALEKAGLRPVGIDLSAFGMIRALAGETHAVVGAGNFVEAPVSVPSYEDRAAALTHDEHGTLDLAPETDPTSLYCNLGDVTNLAVARGRHCLFTRISSFGIEGIAQKLAERRGLTLEHARQWLSHVGLESPVESIEGDPEIIKAAREALSEGSVRLVDELRVTLEYYASQEGSVPIDGLVACGPGTTVPGLVERLARDLGHRCEVGRPQPLGGLDDATAARLTLAYGLALEE